MTTEMTTCGWLLEVMLDDASASYSYRREIDADRGAGAKADSKKAREVVRQLYEALDAILPYAAKYLDESSLCIVKARAALSAAGGGV